MIWEAKILYLNGDIYIGCIANTENSKKICRNGQGEIKYSNGCIYTG